MLRALLISTALASGSSATAQGIEDMIALDILPGWRADDGSHMAALRLQLAPGWKTFWRSPGDAGIPARFMLDASDNVAALTPIWPTPDVFRVAGMQALGYKRELILPLRIDPVQIGDPITLQGQIELGICSDICVPATLDLAAVLPSEGARDMRIQTALIDVPYTPDEAGVQEVTCAIGPVQYGMGFRAEIALPPMGGQETVVVETTDPEIWVAEARAWWEGSVLVTETEMSHVDRPGISISPDDVRITIIGAGQAVEIAGCPTQP